jgi:hypothetical protein
MMNRSLHMLSDAQGTVTHGLLAANVYYVRVGGYVSSKLGIDCSLQLRQHLASTAVTFFLDVASAEGGAFAARSAIMRALLANRRQLNFVTILVGSKAVATRARSMAATLGRPHSVIDSPGLFQTQLIEAVPSARSKIGPTSGTVRIARSVRPSARSMRPRARTA